MHHKPGILKIYAATRKRGEMLKFHLFFDKDEETQWLNRMAQDGWAMTGFFGGFYNFDPCEKGAYQYQVDCTDRFFSVSNDYREFMQEMGAEIVANWGFWTILRKPASEGKFELYTDVDSRIEHYTKIRNMFKVITIIDVVCFSLELLVAARGAHFGFAFALLIGACVLVLANATFKTNDIIEDLKERKTGIASTKKGRCFSPLWIAGMLLNSCVMMMGGAVYIKYIVQILAIILIVTGIFMTMRRRQ